MTSGLARGLTLLLLLLLLLLSACAPRLVSAPAGEGDGQRVRVVTYNIFAGNDLERRSNLSRVAALLDSLGADVVLLQEVDRGTARSGRVDQPAVLAELTGLHPVYAPAMPYGGGEYGIAILSRLPVLESRVVPLDLDLPEDPSREPRTLLHVVLETRGGALHVLNTHLEHRANPMSRRAQVIRLLAHVADAVPPGAAVVLGGDLNARPDAAEVRALGVAFTDAWTACGAGDGFTFRSDAPDRRIDYVLFARSSCVEARVLETTLSDHRPLLVDVRVPIPASR